MADELPQEIQRWTAKRRAALVLSILRGETSAQEAARKHGAAQLDGRGGSGRIRRCAGAPRHGAYKRSDHAGPPRPGNGSLTGP